MHLNTVFILLIVKIQHEEPLFLLKLVHDFNIYVKRTKGSVVLIHVGQGATREVFMMRRPEDEYSLYIIGASDVCISPSCCRSAEVQTCMRANQSLDSLLHIFFLCVVDVLAELCIELRCWVIVVLRFLEYHSPAWRHWRDCLSIINQLFSTILTQNLNTPHPSNQTSHSPPVLLKS